MIIWGSPVSSIMPTWIGGPVGVKAGGQRRWNFVWITIMLSPSIGRGPTTVSIVSM